MTFSPPTPSPSQRVAETLARLDLPAALLPALVAELAPASEVWEFHPGEKLFRENATFAHLLLIDTGKVALEMGVPGRGRSRILSLGAGDIVAWSAVLGNGQMTTSAISLEATCVIALPATQIHALCESNHEVGYFFMKALAKAIGERLVATRLQLLDLFSPQGAAVPQGSRE